MRSVRILLLLTFLLSQSAFAQLITKKESAGIDKILSDLSKTHKPAKYVFRNVHILTMVDSIIQDGNDVLIENGIIQEIRKNIDAPDAIQIDGSGKYLMPGLTDMHVHLFMNHPLKNTNVLLLLINGVTTVRDMNGEAGKLGWRNEINENVVLAPNLYQAGPIINGAKDQFGLFAVATTPEEGRALVIQHKQSGYDFIKVYDDLKKDVYRAILDEARKQNMLVAGHIPAAVSLTEAIQAGQNSAEHLNGYKVWNQGAISVAEKDYALLTSNSNMWNCPTLYNFSMEWSIDQAQSVLNNPEVKSLLPAGTLEIWQKRLKNVPKQAKETVSKTGPGNIALMNQIVMGLYKSNARLIAGTDAGGIPFLVSGFALHEELRVLHETGISIYDVLKMTTSHAALAMNKEKEFGTIETGRRADLLLLDANPLTDLNNLKKKSGLMIRGIWLPDSEIQKISDQIKIVFSN